MSNTISKISISLPTYIYDAMAARLGKREVSQYIASAVEEKLLDDVVKSNVEAFIDLRRRLPKFTYAQIKAAKEKGRA